MRASLVSKHDNERVLGLTDLWAGFLALPRKLTGPAGFSKIPDMRRLSFTLAICLGIPALLAAADSSEVRRYLYLSMPDGAQKEGRSKAGILIFDIDDGHKFVRRIDMPVFEEGLRGFAGNLAKRSVYYSSTNHRLGRFDIESEKKVWEKVYDAGCDRSSVTLDGKKIYVPTGW